MPTNIIVAEKIEVAPFDEIKSIKGDMIISESYPSYLVDESKISGGNAEWLFFPTTENEIVSIINKMEEENNMITISAARTGIVGSAVPFGGAVMSLERMNEVIGIGFDEDAQRWFLRCQPSISLDEINEFVKFKKCGQNQSIPPESDWAEKFMEECTMYYPMDPTEMTASLGGTICANASGAKSFKYGPTRDWVRRIRVVLGTCEVLNITRGEYVAEEGIFTVKTAGKELIIKIPNYQMPRAKNAAGLFTEPNMDLIDLFIGSEGIFGIITEADIWVKEYNAQMSSVGFFKNEEYAIDFVKLLRDDKNLSPEFIEYFDNNALNLLRDKQKIDPKFVNMPNIADDVKTAISFDISYSEEDMEKVFTQINGLLQKCNSSLEDTWCVYEDRELDRLKHFRHAVPEIVNNIIAERKKQYPSIHKLGTDMSVEDQYLKEIMKFYHDSLKEEGLEYVVWGHIGDNHVHVNILPRNLEELKKGKELYMKFAKKAVSYGGSVSAEHGIGKIKHDYLEIMFGEEGIGQMKAIKCKFDPHCLINCGNIFPRSRCI